MNQGTIAPLTGRPRIAVLNRIFSPSAGGAERYSISLVERLAATHDIHVFAQTIEHQWPGVTYHPVSRPFARPRWINQLWYIRTRTPGTARSRPCMSDRCASACSTAAPGCAVWRAG